MRAEDLQSGSSFNRDEQRRLKRGENIYNLLTSI
jgi:hypothetical protein